MRLNGLRAFLTLGAVMAMISASCGGSTPAATGSSAAPVEKKPYTVTVATDRSGAFSASGVPNATGFQAFMADLNTKGGVNGHKINVQALDDRGDVATALANYQQTLASDSLGIFMENPSAVIALSLIHI